MDTLTLKKYHRRGNEDFIEFFINDVPLSKLLDQFYGQEKSILENWTGVLGSFRNPNAEKIKIKQLLGKEVTDKDIYYDKTREELADPKIIIYCCGECGDYDCGGITIVIDRNETSVCWTIVDERGNLSFEFNKHAYFAVFDHYARSLKP